MLYEARCLVVCGARGADILYSKTGKQAELNSVHALEVSKFRARKYICAHSHPHFRAQLILCISRRRTEV
jgi:hypothetical protein